MTPLVSTRGRHAGPARTRRQATLSGQQGGRSQNPSRVHHVRPGDAIAFARKLAEETA
jgi:hypothetical protein